MRGFVVLIIALGLGLNDTPGRGGPLSAKLLELGGFEVAEGLGVLLHGGPLRGFGVVLELGAGRGGIGGIEVIGVFGSVFHGP